MKTPSTTRTTCICFSTFKREGPVFSICFPIACFYYFLFIFACFFVNIEKSRTYIFTLDLPQDCLQDLPGSYPIARQLLQRGNIEITNNKTERLFPDLETWTFFVCPHLYFSCFSRCLFISVQFEQNGRTSFYVGSSIGFSPGPLR